MNFSSENIIVALDLPKVQDAEVLVETLGNKISFYKIGLGLIPMGGFHLATKLKSLGKKVFLDLKLFDISKTIENSVRNLQNLKVDFLTVHGDPQVVRAAATARSDGNMKIFAVTLLTSLDRADLSECLLKEGDITSLVIERARRAFLAGADGVIASPLEAKKIRLLDESKGKLIITPGVRPYGFEKNDQKRVLTPNQALKNGADYIVIGRPVYEARRPLEVVTNLIQKLTV